MSADARLLVDLDLGRAHRSRLTAVSEMFYFIYSRDLDIDLGSGQGHIDVHSTCIGLPACSTM